MTGGPRRFFRRPGRREDEVDEEIRFHIERRVENLRSQGFSEKEALLEARRRFGNVERIQREVRTMARRAEREKRRTEVLDAATQDLSFAARQLGRKPGFTLTVILTVALGIGSSTSIFSVVDGILLRALPYPDPDELVSVWSDWSGIGGPVREWFGFPDYVDFRNEVEALEEFAVWTDFTPTLTGRGEAEQINGSQFSPGMFRGVVRVEPALGRSFLPEEEVPGGPEAVLISHGFWVRAFGGDPNALGQTLSLNDVPHTVVGIMPAGFRPPFNPTAELWTPMQQDMTSFSCGRGCAGMLALGRLADGMSLEVLRQQAHELGERLAEAYPGTHTAKSFAAFPLKQDLVAPAVRALWVLLGAVLLVLLIACVNVANLLLARASTRRGELAVRSALGAGRRRIVRQLLTESALLASLGGAAGIAVAFLGTRLLVSLAPPGTPRIGEVTVSGRILAFAVGMTILSGIVFGLLPALRAAGGHLHGALREGARTGSGRRGIRMRNGLVVGQVALALVLLVGAGLLLRSFQELRSVDLGFDPEGVLALSISLPRSRYPDREATASFYADLEQRVQALPGVVRAASTNTLPLAGSNGDTDFNIEGRPIPAPGEPNQVWFRRVTPGYFGTVGIDLIAGRDFGAGDDRQAPPVVIVNQTLADRYFPDGDVLGQRINVNDPANPTWRTIVGVAADIKNFSIRGGSRNAMYVPYAQLPTRALSIVAKAEGDPAALVSTVRRELAAADPALAAGTLTPIDAFVSGSLATDRFITMLLSLFAGAALILAVVGLYGVVSYGVNSRLPEMGVRIALGAGREQIGSLVIGKSLGLVALGVGVGVAGALGVTGLMKGLLFGVEPGDPVTFVAVAVMLLAVATAASALPARRASRVDPVSVLKAE